MGSTRFLGTMLLMLLFSLLQLVIAEPASATLTAKEKHHFTGGFFLRDSTVSIRGGADPATGQRYSRVDRTDPVPPDAMNSGVSAFPAACCGASERIRLCSYLKNRDSLRLAAGNFNKNTYTSVFYRLKPGIVMVPRMNRPPKPKSVYRCFTRAPGIGHCREV
jgi:hypothetical protein